MKKFFGHIYLFLALLLISLVAVPWNDFSVWGISFSFLSTLTDLEFYIKFGILGFIFICSLIFLFISNKEYKHDEKVSRISALATLVPLMAFTIAFVLHLAYMIYTDTDLGLGIGISNPYSLYIIGAIAFVLLLLILSGVFIKSFKKAKNGGRIGYFIVFLFLAIASAAGAYYFRFYQAVDYQGMSSKYMALVVPITLIFYLICLIVIKRKETYDEDFYESEETIDEIMLSEGDVISSKTSKVEGQQDLYQEVDVDPEFSKQRKQRNKPNSIEYYIDKPKMFKPLNPTFDKLVTHVREFPDVISKLDDEKITFYVSRRPFLVLMNYGDYYRMAFRYELEEGIRLIIKYPTISKNKSTRDELWFKANNYGDLPKEIVYKIVKHAYDVVAR